MKTKTDQLNTKFQYFNAIRGVTSPREYAKALAVVKKVREEAKVINTELSSEQLFGLMTAVSNEFNIDSPFKDRGSFHNVFHSTEEFKELTWGDIVTFYENDMENDRKILVPEEVVNEMMKKLSSNKKNILIAEADKFSTSLAEMVSSNKKVKFTLTTDDDFYFKLLHLMFLDEPRVKVEKTSIYKYGFSNEKYDFIFSVPTFGVREKASEDAPFISRDFEMIALENLALHLESEGTLSIVLPIRITFARGRVAELREFVQTMYSLEEIAELPAGIFKNTGIRTCFLTISTGRTEEVTIKELELKEVAGESRLDSKQETFVFDSELTEMGDWNIDRILQSQDEEWVKFMESSIRKQELGTLTTIFRGKAIGKKVPTGNIGVINISNIGEYEVDYSELDYIEEEDRKIASYLLKTGDLLIPARGTAIRIAIFEEQSYPVIASSNVIIIRANDGSLSTTYLKIFLDSPLGRKMILARQQGATVMNISYKELNDIEIPLPTIEEQDDIAKEYERELEIYKDTIYKAEKRWNETIEKLRNKI